jgi:thiol-disulfide isomerase/thioredoxin
MRRAWLVAPAALAALACARAGGFPGVPLETLGTARAELRLGCATERCLYVYVAPWCGVCRASTGMLRELAAWLRGRGVEAFTIVGMDRSSRVREYAAEFGQDTLLDPAGRAPIRGGVPQLIVTDKGGRVLERQAGMYLVVEAPVPEEVLVWQAARLGLVDRDSPEARSAASAVEQALAAGR